ncbi:MAG: conjugal transfer protein TraX [Defluviitaleaceae bacterium]|nr:conjugal transfer protein TraX [Defluviitaleaceae bacterium]MCL2263212.1 conjugal transfer protein TraX [Defluviitaleaceae bacterium]
MKVFSLDAYTLKWIAVICMVANHIAIGLAPVLPLVPLLVMYAAGGLTYVVMAYFVVEGYRHTSSLKKYIGRLFVFGAIAQIFHPTVLGVTDMSGTGIFFNIMFTIILSLFILHMYDTIKVRFLFWLLFAAACFVSLFMDLYFIGILVPLLYHTIKSENLRRVLPGIVSGAIFGVLGILSAIAPAIYLATGKFAEEIHAISAQNGMTPALMLATPFFAIGCFFGAFLIRNHNGERGKPAKWLFYIAYPLHLAVIAAVVIFLGL